MPTAIAYFVAAMMLWVSSAHSRWHAEIPGTVLLIAGALRELDFQARFTTAYGSRHRTSDARTPEPSLKCLPASKNKGDRHAISSVFFNLFC
jgi:hypothetical protein